MAFDILERDYRRGGIRPDYDSLPLKQDYDAAEAARKAAGKKKDGDA
jgi:hypothetical protein